MLFEPRFRTMVDVYDHAMSTHGSRELFGTKKDGRWTWTTYAEFGSKVDSFRAGLASIGVRPGDRVGIVSNNRVEWAVGAYASFGLGAAFVPMYEAQHADEWEFIVRDCEAKVLLVSGAAFAKAKPLLGAIPSLQHIVALDGAPSAGDGGSVVAFSSLLERGSQKAIQPLPADEASLIYTSGTTGNPKGVILTHGNVASNLSAIDQVFQMGADDRSLSFLPWAHVFGQTSELHVLFSKGASMALCPSVDKLLEDLADVKPTLLFSVPRIFNRIYMAVQKQLSEKPALVQRMVRDTLKITAKERAGTRLTLPELALLEVVDKLVFQKVRARFGGRLKYAFSGGAALSREIAEFIDSLGILVYEGYGLTETSPVVTANAPGGRRMGSVGLPLPGIRVEVDPATAEWKPAESGKPPRAEGEIVVYGHGVMKGYWRRPEENAAVLMSDGGFRTGDMGYVDVQGFLFLTGRIKEQYKLENGKYVVPTPLEEGIKLSPYVLNVMVYGDNRPFNVALVVANVPAVRDWAEKLKTALPPENEALLEDPRVRGLFKDEIDKQMAENKGFERITKFALIADDFTTDNGMITQSLKLKRRKVIEAYGKVLEGLYVGRK